MRAFVAALPLLFVLLAQQCQGGQTYAYQNGDHTVPGDMPHGTYHTAGRKGGHPCQWTIYYKNGLVSNHDRIGPETLKVGADVKLVNFRNGCVWYKKG